MSVLGWTSRVLGAEAERLRPGLISSPKTEINYQLTDSEDGGVFTRAEADYARGKIQLVTLEQGEITGTAAIGFSDPRYKDSDPWLSPTGSELYFISDRPAYAGHVREDQDDYDIFRSRKSGAHWTAPEYLPTLNTAAGEFGPERHRDYLYFSSQESGRYQIYRAREEGNAFTEPELLPAPFNGPHLNSDFTLTRDGRVALWWSTRPGGLGSGDLYVSQLSDEGWTDAENLGPTVNSAHLDFTPSLSPNNAVLFFATNRPFPGQDEGASDLYKIPVADVPPLQKALAASAKRQLLQAFGGEALLSSISSLSYRLEIDTGTPGTQVTETVLDFTNLAIAEREAGETAYRFARLNQPALLTGSGGPLTRLDHETLLVTLSSNFLFYLTAPDLELIGPENISGHGDIRWFRLRARGATSPLLGLDPTTGRIVKVLTQSGAVVLELDYLKDKTGLIWPYRFIVSRDAEVTLSGNFSEVTVNATAPEGAPDWFSRQP